MSHVSQLAHAPLQASVITHALFSQTRPGPQRLRQTGEAPDVSHISQSPQVGSHVTTASGTHWSFSHDVPAAQWSTHTGDAPEVSHIWHEPQAGSHATTGSGTH